MADDTPGDLMRSHDELAEMEEQYRQRKHDKTQQISTALENAVETVVAETPPTAEVYEVNDTGETFLLRLRLDQAELLHHLSDALPREFAVQHLWDDGTLSVRWTETPTDDQQRLDTTIRGIIAEGTPNDEYAPIELVWEDVVDQAEAFGFDREQVERRLHELDDFNGIDVFEEDDETRVAPGDMFQEF